MDNRGFINNNPLNAAIITPLAVHKAFVHLTNYYYTNAFGNIAENPNLKAREEIINTMFPEMVKDYVDSLIPHASSANNLYKISNVNDAKSERDIRESINNIGKIINFTTLPTDACGHSANDTSRLFLGNEGKQLVYNLENSPSFNRFENVDNTLLGEVISFDSPVLIRIEIKRVQGETEIGTHSYCVLVAEEKNELGISTYQAYSGQYALAEWFNDPKFKIQPVNFENYIKQLESLISDNESIRKKAYGELYRLTGSEDEVPTKQPLRIYYKMLPVNLLVALDNINTNMEIALKIEKEINTNNNGLHMTPIEYMKNICWESLTEYPADIIRNIRNVVEAYQAEMQMNDDRFTRLRLSQISSVTPSNRETNIETNIVTGDKKDETIEIPPEEHQNRNHPTSPPDEWKRFHERHPNLTSSSTSTSATPSEPASSPAIESEQGEENNKDSSSPHP